MERLGATDDCRQRLNRNADEVDFGLLRRQADPGGLAVEATQPRTRVFRAEGFAQFARPDAPRRPELGDFSKKSLWPN